MKQQYTPRKQQQRRNMLHVKQLQVFQYLKQSRAVVVAAAAEGMSVRAQRVVVAKCIHLNQVWRIQAQIHLV